MPLTRTWLVGLAAALSLVPRPAFAADDDARARCSDAYVNGQHLLRDRKLVEAREPLLICARSPCAASIQPECAGWLSEAERAVPSVVLAAHDARGKDLVLVSVLVDGQPFAQRIDGASIELDPGLHVFRMEAAGLRPVEQTVVVHEGEKSRLVTATLEDALEATPVVAVDSRRPSRVPAYVLGGVGVAAAASFAYFGISGLVLRGQLASCRGHCMQSQVDPGNADWVGADVSLGVSLVSLGLATYLFLRAQPAPAQAKAAALRLVVAPTPGGGVASVGTTF